ncbi:hypothetical protein [Streptomyces sp. NPDC001536]|uniref:hypothetical protein n=1 Tax=Streptomyces sp. NPDC001536 TaxID=3364583 RepID=UPI0036C04DB9
MRASWWVCASGDPYTGITEDLPDPWVMARIQLATAGKGGDELTLFAHDYLPWLRNQDFSHRPPVHQPGQ